MKAVTLSATEFKATCLDVLDRLAAHELERVTVTKRGRPVAVLTPPATGLEAAERWLLAMRGSVSLPKDADLTLPVLEDVPDAELGTLHE